MAQQTAKYGIAFVVAIAVLSMATTHSHLLFHVLAELFCVLISFSVFLLAWNARGMMKNDFAFFISLALLFTGGFDLFHTLLFDGMGIFSNYGNPEAIKLWIVSRYVLSISFLISPLFLIRKLNAGRVLAILLLTGAVFIQSIFYWENFPAVFNSTGGFTTFKIVSEGLTIAIFSGSALMIRRLASHFDPTILAYIVVSLVLNVISGFLFLMFSVSAVLIVIAAHIVKVLAYFALYKALVEIALMRPYKVLFFELEKNNRFKDDLLSMVSHDLKTPVTSIKLIAETLELQFPPSDKMRNAAVLIRRQANEMGRLVNDFLEFGRIESGRIMLDASVFNMVNLIESCIQSVSLTAPDRQFLFEQRTQVLVRADKQRIGQVMTNLLTNAVKFSPLGSDVVVTLSVADQKAHVAVRDFGRGIQNESLEKVFGKYYRSDEGFVRTEGMGMGLYIAKTFIVLHGGDIWVESEPGIGSTFHFTLPVVRYALDGSVPVRIPAVEGEG